ncbi:MAG: hypothetical protein HRU20_08495 [Pseudomonadales bacterium]|nr:hypothetical protein [Pseudomonadales bacterium]
MAYNSATEDLFKADTLPTEGKILPFSDDVLCQVATGTSAYLSLGASYDAHANHAGIFKTMGISVYRVKKTLDFICQTSLEDAQANRPSRLQNIAFLEKHFDSIRWMPDTRQAKQFQQQKTLLKNLPKDQILMTKYYIKKAQGSDIPTADMPYALYALPLDEKKLSLEQAAANKEQLTRYRYTKQEILGGVLEKKKLATPLVYLSREDLEDSLMQGTVRVDIRTRTGTRKAFFNVHRNNDYRYDRNLKKEDQKRYWYFKEMNGVMGYGKDANHKILIKPQVTVAGDMELLGLGKLILLSQTTNAGKKKHRLVILADTGGAFEKNAYQLDLLSGYYHGWNDYHKAWKHVPDYTEARILILKP